MQQKVLLCGEGPIDYGSPKYGTDQWQEGAAQPIIRKTVGRPVIFDHVEKREIKNIRIQGRAKVSGHAAKAYKLSIIAWERKITSVICYADADKITGKAKKETAAREAFRKVYSEIEKGFNAFNERSINHYKKGIRGIPMAPLRMIESWLMGDEKAFVKCFGKPPSNPPLPVRPELVWGDKEDPESDYPKNLMNRVLKQYHKKGNREIFKKIAAAIEIKTLRNKCSISFESFYNDIQVWIKESKRVEE